MTNPEEIERQIDITRASLRTDVDALGEKVSPSKVVQRRVESVRGTATSLKDRIMGSNDPDSGGLRAAGDSIQSGVSSAKDAVSSAPDKARRRTQGNPLAAGVIAFGIGWLVSSLAPASRPEQELARLAEDKAGDLVEPLQEAAREVGDSMKDPLRQSAHELQQTASDAAGATADDAKAAAHRLADAPHD
jgi:hypothetical protein